MDQKTYQKNLLIPALKILFDAISIEAAFLFSFYLRFHSPLTKLIPVTKGYPPFANYLGASLVLLIIYLALFSFSHAYRSRYFSTFTEDMTVVLKTCFLGILFAMSGAFLYRGFSYSRLTFLLVFFNTIIFLLAGRLLFHRLRRRLMRKGFSITRILLAGSPKILKRFYTQAQRDHNFKFKIEGYCSTRPDPAIPLAYKGDLNIIPRLLEHDQPDGLLIAFSAREQQKVLDILRATEGKNVEMFYFPDILDLLTSGTQTIEVAGMPVLRIKGLAFSGWQGFLKRSFDILVSASALLILSPLFGLLALLVKLTSRGPVFYKQARVGLDGQEFRIIKFRSMRADAEKATGPVWAKANDPRVTPVGKFLRRSSLDELPQLINVLKGEMSLVGPRPERKVFVEQFRQAIPKYAERHRVRSGMTGWAQVNGLRGQSPIEQRTRFDVYYIESWSLWFDIKIILMTFMAIIRGENAY
ncbi:MAG TPA: undecaprenyl-phosphate glucose phosphotransferase [Caldithrix sp.]|nr:undecaprenyl-phosphate glucose phosphotransferase [Caldithrix sp.]